MTLYEEAAMYENRVKNGPLGTKEFPNKLCFETKTDLISIISQTLLARTNYEVSRLLLRSLSAIF